MVIQSDTNIENMSTEDNYYEYIVVGCGGIGSGTLYWLSKRAGKNVLGLEQYSLGHDNGGSQDHSRIVRLMYHDEKYTRLVRHTYTAWEDLERESGVQVLFRNGSLDLAKKATPGEETLERYAKAMSKQNISYERLNPQALKSRFPQYTPTPDLLALYQPEGGLVDAAMGNALHVQLARGNGATVLDNCGVLRVETTDGGATVHTVKGTFRCRRLIITAGAWINHVLGSVGVRVPVIVTQEQVTYYGTPHIRNFTKEKFPVFIYHGDCDIYGMPQHGNSGSKIGVDAGGPSVLPETRNFTPDPVREEICRQWCQELVPSLLGPKLYTKTCLYTMTLDRDFVIDNLSFKGMPQVIVCCGAGHAYKFASFLGRVLSEMAIDGKSSYPIGEFTINRPAVMDPNYRPTGYMLGVHRQEKSKL